MDDIGNEELLRGSRFEGDVAITAMSFSFGSFVIPAEEKARTIKPTGSKPLDIESEIKGMLKLGIRNSSVPADGEDIITGAALSIVKLSLLYNVDLSTIKMVTIATESWNDSSKDPSIEVIALVNRIGSTLKAKGIEIGILEPHIADFTQSACVAADEAILKYAINGIKAPVLVVATDHARYPLGSKASKTEGFGASATLLEPVTPQTKGLIISRSMYGGSRLNRKDFQKPHSIFDAEHGISIANDNPIVYGQYSEYFYMLLTYKALKQALSRGYYSLRDPALFNEFDYAFHTPFPGMPKKALAYFIRHFARTNPEIEAQIQEQVGIQHQPNLNGFSDLESAFSFIVDVEGLYLRLQIIEDTKERIQGSIKNLVEPLRGKQKGGWHLVDDEEKGWHLARYEYDPVNTLLPKMQDAIALRTDIEVLQNSRMIAESLLNHLVEVKATYKISGADLPVLLDSAIENVKVLAKKGGSLKELRESMEKLVAYIRKFEKEDNAYTIKLMETPAYKALAQRLDDALWIAEETGNDYTVAKPKSVAAQIIRNRGARPILGLSFGSGGEAHASVYIPQDVSVMADALKRNIDWETTLSRRLITAERYVQRRREEVVDMTAIPVGRVLGFTLVNSDKLMECVKFLAPERYARSTTAGQKHPEKIPSV